MLTRGRISQVYHLWKGPSWLAIHQGVQTRVFAVLSQWLAPCSLEHGRGSAETEEVPICNLQVITYMLEEDVCALLVWILKTTCFVWCK